MTVTSRVMAPLAGALGDIDAAVMLFAYYKAGLARANLWPGVEAERQAEELEKRLRSQALGRFDPLWERGADLSGTEAWSIAARLIGGGSETGTEVLNSD